MSWKAKTEFSTEDMRAFEPEMKVGILATINPTGLPHLTLISTLRAPAPNCLTFGQFTEGQSKLHLQQNPKVGFLIMTLDKNLWRGKASFTHTRQEGPEFQSYNNTPMFRYNAYFGIHTVYYFDLVEQTGKEPLAMQAVVLATLKTLLAKSLAGRTPAQTVLNGWTRGLFAQMNSLKFLAYIGEDGYPEIIPVLQARALDSERVIFSAAAYPDELHQVPAGAQAALFAMSLDMEDVLLRGRFRGLRRVGGVRCGVLETNWVYNSMPPTPGQIYPPVELKVVRDFE
jgi:hypothetical protein